MSNTELVRTVRTVLSEIISNDEVLTLAESSSLKDDVGLDSMTSLTFLMTLEDRLNFNVDPATLQASDFETIASICTYIRNQQVQNAI